MHEKNIRRIITKQLKKSFLNWSKMDWKSKKELAKQIMAEVLDKYDFAQTLDVPIEELIGIEDQAPSAGIPNLSEMASYPTTCFIWIP